ncbi:MAG: pro-sigmaK processing inhibitor BofA family protein [Clostridia bacterium]|nr:pro-sigmaK processing inhibitor BofA family protein [Clostridia bacterium]MBR6007227.1 pro-sigmaK processing inhibitor BofA family protein [Clostridia bacterium]
MPFSGIDIPAFTIFGVTIPNMHIGFGLLIIIGVILAVYLIFKLFKISIKLFVKFLINALIGAALLFIFNLLFGELLHIDSLTIPINWLTAVVTGVLGVPGVIILLIIRYFTL